MKNVKLAVALIGIAVLAGGVVTLQAIRERRFPEIEPAQQILYVSSPAVMTRMALSYDAIVADVYWIRAIQYYGGTRLSARPDKSYDLLYPLLDLTTALDPNFTIAYRFGAFFLSEKKPGGAGRPDLAVRLLQKAMAARPDRWEYPHDIGFVYYRNGDFTHAAEWFLRAADIPGATNWLRPLAAVTLTTGGDTQSSRILWQNMVTSEADWIRRTAQQRLKQLDAIDQIADLERGTKAYEMRFGDPPTMWDDMVRAGFLRSTPVDPAGYAYVLNPWWGTVTVNEESPLWPLPSDRPA